MSDTPITDAAFDAMQEIPKDIWALRESMRDLERQRNELLEALMEAEAGLEFAGADKEPEGQFVPAPTLALRIVRAAIAKAKGDAQ